MRHIPHLYLPGPWDADELPLTDSQARHLVRVLRLSGGAPVSYTDGDGTTGSGVLGTEVVARGDEQRYPAPQPRLEAAVASPRTPARARFVVEKLAELGIDRLTWLTTRLGEGRPPKPEKAHAWAVSALEQSRGSRLMEVGGPVALSDLPTSTLWVADRESFSPPSVVKGGTLVIGPEAGFEEGEIPASADRLSLGSRVLRIETAAVVGAAVLLEKSGRMAG